MKYYCDECKTVLDEDDLEEYSEGGTDACTYGYDRLANEKVCGDFTEDE